MRIAIDGRTIEPRRSGVGQYAEYLVKSLLEIDDRNEYFLFLTVPNDSFRFPNCTPILIEGYSRMVLNRVWENFLLPAQIRRYGIDLYFSPAFALPVLPRLSEAASLLPLPAGAQDLFNTRRRLHYTVTIHDVIGYLLPQYYTPKMRMWTHFFVPNAVALADTIIAVSGTTKRDLASLFPAAEAKTEVIYPWFNETYRPVTDEELLAGIRKKYSLPGRFILYLGTIEPRKNITGLATAYAALPASLQREVPLVIAGGGGWFTETIYSRIRNLETAGRISFIEYVPQEDLPALYTLASVFGFPSLYEGFGSPPLEAMACGAPVIASDISAMPEVLGEAAVYVSPYSTKQIAGALELLLTDGSLAGELRRRGIVQAGKYDRRKLAERTLEVLVKSAGR
ncbi:MAG TPA: glycosyltransferase family 1 protein [Bacteroidota bacterium]|nr:glycosyltransferase family 1 protein [Bacteroidota bacterium]